MKKILSIIAIALIGAFVLASCNKNEYETEPLKFVNVSGKVTANTNLTSDPQYLDVATAKIIFRIDTKELCEKTVDGYEYTNLQYEAPVTNGKYTIDLPAIKDDVKVTVLPVPFRAMQIQTGKSEEKLFKATNENDEITIYEGGVFYKDIQYRAQ